MPLAFVSSSRFVGLRLQEETGRPVLSLVDLEETGDMTKGRGERGDGRPPGEGGRGIPVIGLASGLAPARR